MNLLRSSVFRRSMPALWILILMTSIGPFGDTEYTPSLPAIAHDLHVTYTAVQQSMTVYLLAYAAMQLLYGPLSDKIGRKPVALWGALLFTAGSFVCYISNTLDLLLLGRALQGLGSCAGAIISSAAVRDSFDKDKIDIIYTKINAAFALAPATGPIVGAIVDDRYGWHANMFILLILGSLLLVAVLLFFPETHMPDMRQKLSPSFLWHNYIKLFAQKDFFPAIFINGIAIGVVYTSLTEGPALVTHTLGLSSKWIAVVAIGVLVAFTIGSFAGIYLEKRYHSWFIVKFGLLLIIFGAFLLALSGYFKIIYLYSTLLPIMLSFSGIALVVPNSISIAMIPFKNTAGTASAMVGFSQMGIAALSNVGVSFLPFGPIYALAIIFSLLAGLGLLIYFLRPRCISIFP